MEIHQVYAKQGLQWILSGFYLFRRAPLAWFFVCFTLLLIGMSISLIPLVGQFFFTLISPVFLAGIMLGCKDMEQGKSLELAHLFAAFKTNAVPLITLGGIYLIGQILIIGLVMLIGGTQMTDMMLYGKRVDESELMGVMSSFLTASLIALTLSIPLMMASWFSPLLVVFHNMPPVIAMQKSFFACLRNFIPFQLYGFVLIILTIICVMPYGVGLVILIPTIFASIYVSYKDIFLGEPIRFKNYQPDFQQANWSDSNQEADQRDSEIKREASSPLDTTSQEPEAQVECAQCHVRMPRNQVIANNEQFFCCEEHRRQYDAAHHAEK